VSATAVLENNSLYSFNCELRYKSFRVLWFIIVFKFYMTIFHISCSELLRETRRMLNNSGLYIIQSAFLEKVFFLCPLYFAWCNTGLCYFWPSTTINSYFIVDYLKITIFNTTMFPKNIFNWWHHYQFFITYKY